MRRQMVTTMYNNVLSNVTFDIGLHEVCVRTGGRTLRHNQIFSDGLVLLENRRSSQGGAHPLHPPRSAPDYRKCGSGVCGSFL